MVTYYQVCAGFKFSDSKPQLVSLSLHSTSEFFPYLVGSPFSPLSYSRYFRTVTEANHFIDYLFSHQPNSTVPRPVLDALQLRLFNGL